MSHGAIEDVIKPPKARETKQDQLRWSNHTTPRPLHSLFGKHQVLDAR